jgi:uncharacterized membrane protein YgcG
MNIRILILLLLISMNGCLLAQEKEPDQPKTAAEKATGQLQRHWRTTGMIAMALFLVVAAIAVVTLFASANVLVKPALHLAIGTLVARVLREFVCQSGKILTGFDPGFECAASFLGWY